MFRRRLFMTKKKPVVKTYIHYIATNKIVPESENSFGATYNEELSSWDSNSGEGIIVFDGEINKIPSYAFYNNKDLQSIFNISDTVKNVKYGAFQSCINLQSITLGNNIETIASYAFYDCTSLKRIEFNENFKNFINADTISNDGSTILNGCINLEHIIWNSINCKDFQIINADDKYESTVKGSPFISSNISTEEGFISPIKNVEFGDKVENIPYGIFWKCANIENILKIPNTCKRIGDRAFQGCVKLVNIYINSITPPKIEYPEDGSFAPDGVNSVFRYFDNGWNILPNITIFVPKESLNAYKEDIHWSLYKDYIKPKPEYKAIDLGLRTSDGKKILFADRNVGASSPEDRGLHFQWGDILGYSCTDISENEANVNGNKMFDWSDYKYSNSDGSEMLKYNNSDNLTKLEITDDAANAHMGGDWRMPTVDELALLQNEAFVEKEFIKTDGTVSTTFNANELLGIRFISKIEGFEGNSIFIPAAGTGNNNTISTFNNAGCIWSSSIVSKNINKARYLYFYINNNNISLQITTTSKSDRKYGRCVRGVLIQ